MFTKRYHTLIVGGGPAALAPLVSASRTGLLNEVLARGVVVIERGTEIGAGRLGNYAICSDSTAQTFLSAVTDHLDPRLGAIQNDPIYRELLEIGQDAIPLVKAAELMRRVGAILHKAIVNAGGLVLLQHEAASARCTSEGDWLTTVRPIGDDRDIYISSRNLVLATGGGQPPARLFNERVAETPLLPRFQDKLIQSDDMLQPAGVAKIVQRLALIPDPRVAIVGGSTSALAAADLLLKTRSDLFSKPASITILHRRPLRLFYRSREEALKQNYLDFGPDDICPVSGFVFRLAGFRLHSRDLLMRILEIGGAARETRVTLHRLTPDNREESQSLLKNADIVIAALGYRPCGLRLFNEVDEEIPLSADDGATLVDSTCQVLDHDRRPIRNVFGIGLAAGFVPSGSLGGEKSFVGQANGLWLWQTAVGSIIINAILNSDTSDLEDTADPAWIQAAASGANVESPASIVAYVTSGAESANAA